MNTNYQDNKRKRKSRTPLFNSPWLALFLVVWHEWLQPRPSSK